MKKVIFSLSVLFLSATAFAQSEQKNEITNSVSNTQSELKGPEYKNKRFSKNSEAGLVKNTRKSYRNSAEYKNNRSLKAPVVGEVKVVRSTLTGPEYKNKRF